MWVSRQNLDPELRAAGHPELTFELDGQSATMPRHWAETNRVRGAQAWLVGQAVALREAAAQTANAKVNDDKRQRATALAALLGLPVDAQAADQLARDKAGQSWTETDVRSRLTKLASAHDQFAGAADPSSDQAQRAERLVLGLERLLVALQWEKQPALSTNLDSLFKAVQSRPDFSPKPFAEHLKAFAEELKTVPGN